MKKIKITKKRIKEFLKESNAIEGEYEKDALNQAIKAWEFLMEQDIMNPQVICDAHGILAANAKHLNKDQIGGFRDCNVMIGGKYGMPPDDLILAMFKWCQETMKPGPVNDKNLHILFEIIHPFIDYNGRMGRMLMNWTRIKRNKQDILIIREMDRQEYYKWFRE